MICLLGGATSSLDLCGFTGGLRPASPQYVSHLLAPSTSNNYIQAQLTADTSESGVMYLCWQCSGSTVISTQSTHLPLPCISDRLPSCRPGGPLCHNLPTCKLPHVLATAARTPRWECAVNSSSSGHPAVRRLGRSGHFCNRNGRHTSAPTTCPLSDVH